RRLVIALSTPRPIARASFHTTPPRSRAAWRIPSRSVTASKLPPGIVRTKMASGRPAPTPSIAKPVAFEVAKPHAVNLIGIEVAPRGVSARDSARACQSRLSPPRPTRRRRTARRIAIASGERRIEKAEIQFSGAKGCASFNRRHHDLGGTEEHRIDGVKIAVDARKQFRKRTSVVTRSLARQLLRKRLRV